MNNDKPIAVVGPARLPDQPKRSMVGALLDVLGMATTGNTDLIAASLPRELRPREPKPLRVCALPGCEKQGPKTYCSADHCHEHRRSQRERGLV